MNERTPEKKKRKQKQKEREGSRMPPELILRILGTLLLLGAGSNFITEAFRSIQNQSPDDEKIAEVLEALRPQGEEQVLRQQFLKDLQGVYEQMEIGHFGTAESQRQLAAAEQRAIQAEVMMRPLEALQYTLFDGDTNAPENFNNTLEVQIDTFLDWKFPESVQSRVEPFKNQVRDIRDNITQDLTNDQMEQVEIIFAEGGELDFILKDEYLKLTAPFRELLTEVVQSQLSAEDVTAMHSLRELLDSLHDSLPEEVPQISTASAFGRALGNLASLIPPSQEAGYEGQAEWVDAVLALGDSDENIRTFTDSIDSLLILLDQVSQTEALAAQSDADRQRTEQSNEFVLSLIAAAIALVLLWVSNSRSRDTMDRYVIVDEGEDSTTDSDGDSEIAGGSTLKMIPAMNFFAIKIVNQWNRLQALRDRFSSEEDSSDQHEDEKSSADSSRLEDEADSDTSKANIAQAVRKVMSGSETKK